MTPTLDDGDILLVRAAQKSVARGAVVIADVPGLESNIQVKRLVGLPCDRIVFEDSMLFINGAIHSEPYLSGLPHTVGLERMEWNLGSNEYFLLGDNRSRSVDSRRYGPVQVEAILANARWRLWPLKRGFRLE